MNINLLDQEQALAVFLNVEVRNALEDLHCRNPKLLGDAIMKEINIAVRNASYGALMIVKAGRNGHQAALDYIQMSSKSVEAYWEAPELTEQHASVLSRPQDAPLIDL